MHSFDLFCANCYQNAKNTYYPNKKTVRSADDLFIAVQMDNVSASFRNNKRSIDNYISSKVVITDIDNDHTDDSDGWVDVDSVMEAFPDVEFYYVPSRNHMKSKRKKDKVLEPRFKGHIYFPLSREYSSEEYLILKQRIGALFPYFDQKVLDIPHFIYGVDSPEIKEIEGRATIDEYIDCMVDSGELNQAMSDSLKEYHKHEEWLPVPKWDEVVNYHKSVKEKSADDSSAISGDDYSILDSCRRVEKFLELHNVEYEKQRLSGNSYQVAYYVTCPWSENHTESGSKTETAVLINSIGAIMFICHHSHCADKNWSDYKAYYEARDKLPEAVQYSQIDEGNTPKFEVNLVSGRDLQKKNLPPIKYAIDGMIPEGYSVFSAPFKMGKSWMALECCLAIASGSDFLGMHTTKGSAVYLALEDCDKFAQDRLNTVLNGIEAPEGFYYIYDNVPTLDDGLIEYLNVMKTMVNDLRLVVIDVLAKVECQAKRGETAYHCDYRTGTALKNWADINQISVMAITHTTKHVHVEDVFMNTTGTNGVTGSADAILTINKEKRTDRNGILAITGRRVREKYLKVHLQDGYKWESEGETDPEHLECERIDREEAERKSEYMNSPIRSAIIKLTANDVQDRMRASEIIERAREFNIFLSASPKMVGGFIHKFKNLFTTEDGVLVNIIDDGTASKVYKFGFWEHEA